MTQQTFNLLDAYWDGFPETLLWLDRNQFIQKFNPAAEKFFGTSLKKFLNRPLLSLSSSFSPLLASMQLTLTTGHSFIFRHHTIVTSHQEMKETEIQFFPLENHEGSLMGGGVLIRDLSEHKKIEEEIKHHDRLSLMGTLAAGLAHEIKNPLGGIKTSAQILHRELEHEESKEYLEIIIRETNRVNQLLSELLTFTKPQAICLEPLNIHSLLDEIFKLEKPHAQNKPIRLIRSYDPSLPMVLGDPHQLKQAFLNLIKNAFEALEESHSGLLQVSSRILHDFHLKIPGDDTQRIVIEIQDNGCGMDEEALSKIFSPFYSTKSKGSGLGLLITQRIIHEHQGMIQVDSKLHQGTTFKVFLKVATETNTLVPFPSYFNGWSRHKCL